MGMGVFSGSGNPHICVMGWGEWGFWLHEKSGVLK